MDISKPLSKTKGFGQDQSLNDFKTEAPSIPGENTGIGQKNGFAPSKGMPSVQSLL